MGHWTISSCVNVIECPYTPVWHGSVTLPDCNTVLMYMWKLTLEETLDQRRKKNFKSISKQIKVEKYNKT